VLSNSVLDFLLGDIDMAKNDNLHKAKDAKNDEFYTRIEDVAEELRHYKKHFAGKVVFCNCDDPTWSAFWRYFHLNFAELGLKKLISTHYDRTEPTYKMEYEGGNDNDVEVGVKTPLEGNGDFRSKECLDLLDECDIVVTNEPFSLFREYVGTLMQHGKKFLIIGNKNAITYKEFFPLLKENKVWIGYSSPSEFDTPNGMTKKINGLTRWFTNLDIQKRHEKLILWQRYYDNDGNPMPDAKERYPHYDNYDAINVGKVADIPIDYQGVMGVPITFLDKYNPEQFEIVGLLNSSSESLAGIKELRIYDEFKEVKQDGSFTKATGKKTRGNPVINGKAKSGNYYINPNTGECVHSTYARILIHKKENE
jgi:hypothetical protein